MTPSTAAHTPQHSGATATPAPAPAPAPAPESTPGISVLAGNPTHDERAAVSAVLSAVLRELSDENERYELPTVSAWERSQRPMRTTLTPGAGSWRGFSA